MDTSFVLTIKNLQLAHTAYLLTKDRFPSLEVSFGEFCWSRYGWGYPDTDNQWLKETVRPASYYDLDDRKVWQRLYELAVQKNQLGLFDPKGNDQCPG